MTRSPELTVLPGRARGAPHAGVLLIALATAGAAVGVEGLALGPLGRHMAEHILLMNVAAPALSLALARGARVAQGASYRLGASTSVQLVTLWVWHAPGALAAAHASPALHVLMQASLLGSAMWFWIGVLGQEGNDRWRAIAALLLTGKLFCLLGVLLAFAPRLMLLQHTHAATEMDGAMHLADQQLAGLMMLTACPVTYVLAAVVIAACWLGELQPPGPKGGSVAGQ